MAINQPINSPTAIAEVIDYQPDSIISRALLTDTGGSVTLFAFDQGQQLSEHTTPHDAFIHVIEGLAAIRIASETHNITAGHAIHLPANIPHAVFAPQQFKMILAMIRTG